MMGFQTPKNPQNVLSITPNRDLLSPNQGEVPIIRDFNYIRNTKYPHYRYIQNPLFYWVDVGRREAMLKVSGKDWQVWKKVAIKFIFTKTRQLRIVIDIDRTNTITLEQIERQLRFKDARIG